MSRKLVIIGAGFAGLWSALSAARLRDAQGASPADLEILVVAPQPILTIRPRLYEDAPETMAAPLDALFESTDVRFLQASVETIDSAAGRITVTDADGVRSELPYDRLVLAAGSDLNRPPLPGLARHAFSVDRRDEAAALDRHVRGLAARPASAARDTVVVAGGGFTGIETAAEFPARLRAVLGPDAAVRVVVVERADAIGPDLGPGPRPVIEQALAALGVECRLGVAIAAVDAAGATLSNGERIDSATVIWTGGVRATPLTRQIPSERDALDRLMVDRALRVPGAPRIFATGDAANAATDDHGNRSLMSCQHALILGRTSGHNAAADLLGAPTVPYSQERYVTCLDLGPWGALFSEGWDRVVTIVGADAKAVKQQINGQWIYPPPADRAAAFAAADPAYRF